MDGVGRRVAWVRCACGGRHGQRRGTGKTTPGEPGTCGGGGVDTRGRAQMPGCRAWMLGWKRRGSAAGSKQITSSQALSPGEERGTEERRVGHQRNWRIEEQRGQRRLAMEHPWLAQHDNRHGQALRRLGALWPERGCGSVGGAARGSDEREASDGGAARLQQQRWSGVATQVACSTTGNGSGDGSRGPAVRQWRPDT